MLLWTTLAFIMLGCNSTADGVSLDAEQMFQRMLVAKGGAKLDAVEQLEYKYGKNSIKVQAGRFEIRDHNPPPLGEYSAFYDENSGQYKEVIDGKVERQGNLESGAVLLEDKLMMALAGLKDSRPSPIGAEYVQVDGNTAIKLTVRAKLRTYVYLLDPKTFLPKWFISEVEKCKDSTDPKCGYALQLAGYKSYEGVMLPTRIGYGKDDWGSYEYRITFKK